MPNANTKIRIMRRAHTNYYSCILASDLVLPKSRATEVNLDVLDFIPGANFRGAVSKQIFQTKDQAFIHDALFSGRTVFGDARLEIAGQRSWPIPLDWKYVKGKDKSKASVGSQLTEEDWKKGLKYKSFKQGYCSYDSSTESYKCQKANFQAFPKSARNRARGSSKDGQMFIYKALQEEQKFHFYISADDQEILNKIDEFILGSQLIGKSRKAEFGYVQIAREKEFSQSFSSQGSEISQDALFFTSRCCLISPLGQYTALPDLQTHLKLNEEARILWHKSTIRTERYSPWNGHRRAADPERLCISAGSVLIIEGADPEKLKALEIGIGRHQSEGFGEVLINPPFLQTQSITLDWSIPKSVTTTSSNTVATNSAYPWVQALLAHKAENPALIKSSARTFKDKYALVYSGLPNNQWSALCVFAQQVNRRNQSHQQIGIEEILKPMRFGQKNQGWRDRDRLDILIIEVKSLAAKGVSLAQQLYFLQHLARIMPVKKLNNDYS